MNVPDVELVGETDTTMRSGVEFRVVAKVIPGTSWKVAFEYVNAVP